MSCNKSGTRVLPCMSLLELILDCCTDIVHFEDGSIIDQFPMDADGLEKIRNYFIKGVSVK